MSAIFNFIGGIFAVPFGWILSIFYNFTGSYILAIILLTILVKLCLLPFSINQQKDLVKRTKLNLKIKNAKQRYAENEEKLKEKIEELKKEADSGKKNMGCLTSIFQLFVFVGLFKAINTPLTSILQFKDTTIEAMKNVMAKVVETAGDSSTIELNLLQEATNYKDALITNGVLTEQNFLDIATLQEKFKFMGINLSLTPELTQFNALWLIPVLVMVISLISALYSHIKRKKRNPGKGKFTALEAIPFITPLIYFVFAFMFPAGIGLYWAISNLLSFIQQLILTAIYNPDKIVLEPEPITEEIENTLIESEDIDDEENNKPNEESL